MKANGVLIIGPTGSGKSPLGDYLEQVGLNGSRCLHFDFGKELRSIAEKDAPLPGFDASEHAFIKNVLFRGVLLENEHFPIARKIVKDFFLRHSFRKDDLLVMNGLPRHVDQAKDMASFISIRGVIVLSCGVDHVIKRIELNSGGDRSGRTDDSDGMIRRKLEIFRTRTSPLIDFCRASGAAVFEWPVTEETSPSMIYSSMPSDFSRTFSAC